MLLCISAASASDATDDTLASDDASVELGASGDTIYVDSSSTTDDEQGTESNPYKTISAAVNSENVTGGETIFIKNGNYSESSALSFTKSVNLVGESKEGVAIATEGNIAMLTTSSAVSAVLSFENLTFKDSARTGGNGLMFFAGTVDLNFTNCNFIDLSSKYGAMQTNTAGTINIKDCTFSNVKEKSNSPGAGAMYLNGGGVTNIYNTIFENCGYEAASGQMNALIYVYGSKNTLNMDRVIIRNTTGPATSIIRSSGVININNSKIVNNTVSLSSTGYVGDSLFYVTGELNINQSVVSDNNGPKLFLYKNTAADFTMNYCNVMNNTFDNGFTDSSAGDYDVNYNYWGSNKLPSGVEADVRVIVKDGAYQLSNGQPLTVEIPDLPEPKEDEPAPEIIYADAEKGSDSNTGAETAPVKTIAKAVELAQDGNGKIIINAGTYDVNAIQTSFNNLTIGTNGTVVLNGNGKKAFYVKSGSLSITNVTFTNCNDSYTGAVIRMDAGSELSINDCKFIKNGGEYREALIYVVGATLTVNNTLFEDNTAHKTSTNYGGIEVKNQGKLYIYNSQFINNFNKYGQLYISSSYAEVYNTSFIGNNATSSSGGQGAAIYVGGTTTASSAVYVKDCKFINNTAKGNKGSYYNYGGKGGVFYVNNNATAVIEGSYFENNVAETVVDTEKGQGGVFYASAGNITVVNSIFEGNDAVEGSVAYLKYYAGSSYSPMPNPETLNRINIKDSLIIGDGVAFITEGSNFTVDVNENYWNSNDNPADKVSDDVTVENWIIMDAKVVPDNAQIGDNITVEVAFEKLQHADGSISGYNGILPEFDVAVTSDSGKLDEIVTVKDNRASTENYTIDITDNVIAVGDEVIPLTAGVIYVSPDGDDSNAGTEDAPVKTIAKAIEISIKGKIVLLNGTHKTGDLGSIYNDLTISGQGDAIVDAQNNNRVLYVGTSGNVVIEGITFINGYTSDESGALFGNSGNLTIINCILANSTSSKNGGAIYNAGNLIVSDSTFENNKASQNGGAIFTQNAGIGQTPTLAVTNSAFTNNGAGGTGNFGGGAIFAQQAADGLSIENSNFTANYVEKSGGGAVEIVNVNVATIAGCNFVANSAKGEDSESNYGGGAISFVGAYSDKKETLTVSDSLFESNTVDGLGGGAIYARASTVNVDSSVLIGNLDDSGYAVYARVTNYVTPSVTVNDNWWGSSESPKSSVSDKVTLNRWAVLTVSNDTAFVEGKNVTITADINSYTTGSAIGTLAKPISIARDVTIETSAGNIEGTLENGAFSTVFTVPADLKFVDVTVDSRKENLFVVTSGTTVKLNNVSAKKAERPVYIINVTSADGTIVNQGVVELFINDVSMGILDVENGTAKGKFVVSLAAGTYEILAKYTDEAGLFEESFGTATLTVSSTRNDYIYNSNFHDYFDEDGYLYDDIPYTNLYFRDNFNAEDLGLDTITIAAPMHFNIYSNFTDCNN